MRKEVMIKKCKKEKCVPVIANDMNGNVIEVFCQNCTKAMTQREHKEYFDKYIPWFEKKFKWEYSMIRPNYDFRDERIEDG